MKIKTFSLISILFIILLSCALSLPAFADELPIYDDCVDLSVVHSSSEEVYPSVIDEESRAAYDDDYTMLMRNSLSAASIVYKIPSGRYPTFNAYFRQNEEISHFGFEFSADGEAWQRIEPSVNIKNVEITKWIPVTYILKNIPDSDCFVRITFSDKNSVEWSPMLASVCLGYKNMPQYGFFDCQSTRYFDATAKLKALGFVSGVNEYEFCPDNTLSRAELAVFCSRLLKLNSDFSETVFYDVDFEHFAAGEIGALYRCGIISGDENGFFNPSNDVTYAEVAKMLVAALGYSVKAEENGGYPIGYTTLADSLDLFKNVDCDDLSSAATRGDAAIMLCNALNADLMYCVDYGYYQRYEKGDILSVYHNIKEVDGLVSSAGGLSVISDVICGEDTAVINDTSYQMSAFDMTELLGVSVRAYVDKESKEILYAENKRSDITVISAEKEPVITSDELCYTENNKQRKVALEPNTRIVYNGRYKTRAALTDELDIQSGSITFVDNKGDGSDVALIWEYKSYVAASDGYLESNIHCRMGETLNIDLSKAERVRVFVNGEETKRSDAFIRRGDVILLAESEDKGVVTLYVTSDSISGKTEYYNKDTQSIKINGEAYTLAKNFAEINGEASVGAEVIAYRDINGRIFAVELCGGYEYAYLIQTVIDSPLGDEVCARLLCQDGNIRDLIVTQKTKLNGYSGKVSDVLALPSGLLRVKLADSNTLSAIETAIFSHNLTGSAEFVCNYSSKAKYYGGSMRVFASKYRFDTETPIFLIPGNTADKSEYKVIDINSLYSDFAYDISIYDVSDELEACAAVIYAENSDERAVASYDNIGVIRSSSVFNNAKGEPCLMLSVYSRGEEREIYFDNKGGIDNTGQWLKNYTARSTANGKNPFKPGEVIQYYSDSESHCKSYRMLLTDEMIINDSFYENNVKDYGPLTEENYFSELYAIFGSVKIKTSDKIVVAANEGASILRTVPTSSCGVYIYYSDRNILVNGDAADLSVGDKVFARMSYADTTDILIVR